MKAILTLLTGAFLLTSCGTKVDQPTVTRLDAARYSGKWHEVGRLPNRFEKNIVAATATYTLQPDGSLSVLNNGLKSSGELTSIPGSATQPESKQPGRLKVRFTPFPANLFAGDYWILALSRDYSRAMIGAPNQKYLWFLSKDKRSTKENFEDFVQTAGKLDYDTSAIYWNPKRLD